MSFKLSDKSIARMEGVNPQIREIANLAIQLTKVDFGIPNDGGVRTAERQKELYDSGKSKADGYVNLSNHQSGEALDFYAYVDGKASWDEYDLAMVACAFLQAASVLKYPLNWGGLFHSFKDMPHVELA